MVGFVCYHRRGFSWEDGIVTWGFDLPALS